MTAVVDPAFKAQIVALILSREPEKALEELSLRYQTAPPRLRIGPVRGYGRRALAVYEQRDRTIYAVNREAMYDPFVILHEFYHHLRTTGGEHRGTERYADRFAKDFLAAYEATLHGANTRHQGVRLRTSQDVIGEL